MFDPSETLSCGCVVELRSERCYVTPCSPQHRTTAQMMRKPGSTMIIRPVPDGRCVHGRSRTSRVQNPCPPGSESCQ